MEKNFTWILAGSFAVLLVIVAIALYLFRSERNKFINLQKLVLNQSGFGNTAVAYIRARMAAEQLNLRRPFAHWFLPDYLILTETCLQRALTELRAITTFQSPPVSDRGFWYQWRIVTEFLFLNDLGTYSNVQCKKFSLKPEFHIPNRDITTDNYYGRHLLGPLNDALRLHIYSLILKEGKHLLRGGKEKSFLLFSDFIFKAHIKTLGLPFWVSLSLFSNEHFISAIFRDLVGDIATTLAHGRKEIMMLTVSNQDKVTMLEQLQASHFLKNYDHFAVMKPVKKVCETIVAELDALYFQFGQQSTVAIERAKFIGKITDLELQKKLQSVDAVIG